MAPPKQKNISRTGIFIWDESSGSYIAWDGVLNTSDIEIGAVEIKDGSTDQRASVNGSGELAVTVGSTTPPAGFQSGQKTVTAAGTAEAIATTTTILSVTVTALRTNTGNIYVGGSGVDSTNGHVLVRGASVSINIDDLAKVYIDADTNGEGVSFAYVTA